MPIFGSRIPGALFNGSRMFDYLAGREAYAKAEVDDATESEVLAYGLSEVAQRIVESSSIQPVIFLWDDVYQDKPQETKTRVRDFEEFVTIPATSFTIHVPFTGNAELLGVEPNTGNMNPPHGSVRGSEVILEWQGPPGETTQVKAWFDQIKQQLKNYGGWSKQDCDQFNAALPGKISGWLKARKDRLEKNRDTASVLEIPIGRKPSPSTDLVPVPKRRPIVVQRPAQVQGDVQHELRISDEDYVAIIQQLSSARGLLERQPETFSAMGEEPLRDLLLVILNNQFGPAVGEMFSRKGKTDIVIVRESGPVFIAECKIWSGEKAFGEAVEQLLGYLVWRDTKAAIVVFVREKDVTGITTKALAALAGHARQVSHGDAIGDVPTEILHQEGDPRRHIRLAPLLLPVPPVT